MFLQTFDSRQSMVAVLWVWHSVQRLGDCLHLCVEDRLDIAITAIAARRKKSLKDVNSYIPIIFFFQSCLGTGAGPIPEIRTELFFLPACLLLNCALWSVMRVTMVTPRRCSIIACAYHERPLTFWTRHKARSPYWWYDSKICSKLSKLQLSMSSWDEQSNHFVPRVQTEKCVRHT